jgi:hypothetical protein
MARVYEINGEWKSWNYMHDHLGYTRVPTTWITYKSANPETWGEDTSDDGYYTNGETSSEYFVNGKLGWWSRDGLSNIAHLMPSFCETDDLYFSNGVTISVAALFEEIEPEEARVYLIAAVMNLGWKTLAEWQELGWDIAVADVPLFGGDFSGNKITMESVDGGGSLIDKYAHYKALFELRGWSPGGDFTEYQAIGGILTGTSDDAMFVQAGSMGGVIDEYVPPVPVVTSVEVNLGLRWDVSGGTNTWLAKTFPANDWWWSGILSQEDVDTIESVGGSICPTTNPSEAWPGLIGALKFEPYLFTYELLDMYSGIGEGSVPFVPSYFSLIGLENPTSDGLDYRSCMIIKSTTATSTPTKSYRVRITNKYPEDRDSIFVLLGLKYDYSSTAPNYRWTTVYFNAAGDYYWAGLLNAVDQAKLQAMGLISDTSYPFDEVLYSEDYEYECVAVYDDMFGYSPWPESVRQHFYVDKAASYSCICLYSDQELSGYPMLTWCCKITPKVPNSDYVKGTISGLTLPTAHSGQYSSVLFNSLRYYVKGTLSNTGSITGAYFGYESGTWYYGTITWVDSSLRDLSGDIAISSLDARIINQSVFRIIIIGGSAITGYLPEDPNAITSYSYNNGTHTLTFYSTDNWTASQYSGRIQLRYLDGVSTFKKLSAFDLVDVSSGTLSKATTTDRYDMYNVWNGDITVIAKYNG